jgi:GTP-sensing pleiotropic transcriptional regulator CodY
MGNIGYVFDEDEDEDHNAEERIVESKHNPSKKKKSAKKMKETTENNKFKQTRLIFTPKEESMTGQKRLHTDSPKEFNEDEEEDEE